ncbi:DM13 domain-containing protein [Catellatospora sp. KI3]|uniref:DM13 domain-containing protein n=1 Tax=Catellatospora sp. KI3 TaxID=3041620 RepID=UPI002482C4DA|nr:DM13 domain-containing protein [Catellatospora sp. KI3]MDI1460820.1 DM13 domain-containing protein [Catellatospora sp. KI3]
MSRIFRKPAFWAVAAVVVVGMAFGLYWFQPWKLLTSQTVNDAVPAVVAPTATPAATPALTPGEPQPSPVAVLVAEGALVTHEHDTSGTVQLVRLPDGRYQVILRDLATSDGPDLHVWLTDQQVLPGRDGWHVFDDGKYADLGKLKGTHGTQLYDVPANVDPVRMRSVTIWCKRFKVSFAAAPLQA